jgi:tetratricopeptide (TPR) repeat protein
MPNGAPHDRQLRDDTLRRAQFAITNQRPADAEHLAASILETNPGHFEATKILGYALMMLGRPRDAVDPLEKLARRSRDAEIETQLAIALRQTGRGEKALMWLNRAIKRKPPFPAAFHELGFVLKSLRRYDEAIEVLEQGIRVAPMVPEIALHLGYAYHAINDRTNARKFFVQAYSINPMHSEAIHALGMALMSDQDYAQAAELFRRVLAADPADNAARIGLGSCFLSLGQADLAYACLRAATARGPQFFGKALKTSAASSHGRFWLRPSDAAKFFKREKV